MGLAPAARQPCRDAAGGQTQPDVTPTGLAGATGLRVTVSIAWRPFREGEQVEGEALRKIVYEIAAFACNGGGAC